MHTHMHTHTHTHTPMHAHVHAHTHTHTHMHCTSTSCELCVKVERSIVVSTWKEVWPGETHHQRIYIYSNNDTSHITQESHDPTSHLQQHSSIVHQHIHSLVLLFYYLSGCTHTLLTTHIQSHQLRGQPLPLQFPHCLTTTFCTASYTWEEMIARLSSAILMMEVHLRERERERVRGR